MILIQPKNYTSCHVCNKLNNGKFLFQNIICVYFLNEIRILRHTYLDKLRVLVNPVGLMLNVCLCRIVNIHVLYKYEIDLIATDKCYCDVTLYSCGAKGWMQCI